MSKFIRVLGALTIAIALQISAGPAQAQATRTWVSGVGDDVNPCSRTAPCKTFAGAISKTAANGEINVLDPGGFGAVTITKAITISNDGVGTAGVLVSGTNGIVIAAGATDVVTLRGLDIDGLGPTGGSLAGVQFNSGAALLIDHCNIYGFKGANGAGWGVSFTPSSGTAATLTILDSIIQNNGSTGGTYSASGNVLIAPTGAVNVTADLKRNQLLDAFHDALLVYGAGSTGTMTITLSDSLISQSGGSGIKAQAMASGGGTINLSADNDLIASNGSYGVHAVGANATIRLSRSTVTGNVNGIGAGTSAALASYLNNNVSGNGTDGTSTTTVTLK